MARGKDKKIRQAILDSLKEKASLSTNKGVFDKSVPRKPTPKQRRHRGWRTPNILQPTMKFSEMVENAFEPVPMYDDWKDFRDGMRDTARDRSRFIPVLWRGGWWWGLSEEEIVKRNKVLKKLEEIKQAKRKSKRGFK